MSLALWHWHIEVSSKCTLKCPRCPRQEVPDTLVNTELELAFFTRNFPPDFITEHVEKLTFCGDDGDPIYARDFIHIIKYFKSVKNDIAIVIVTNGSYKNEGWWKELASLLGPMDQIHFSIDGWDHDSNNVYRINSNWSSIVTGASIINNESTCYSVWDAIGFKFNEDKIEDMKAYAKELGFDAFQLTKSTKFGKIYEDSYGKDDALQPSDKLLSSSHRFEREVFKLTDKFLLEPWMKTNIKLFEQVHIVGNEKPLCHIGNKGTYINAKGEFYPCCWVATRYGHNNKWNDLGQKYSLHKTNLTEVIKDNFWKTEFIHGSYECQTKCDAKIVNKNYATEW